MSQKLKKTKFKFRNSMTHPSAQLRESKINSKDSFENHFFNWSLSQRTGPHSQNHNLCESRIKIYIRFYKRIFNSNFCYSRQITDLVLTAGIMSINRIPVDINLRTIISPADLLYPTLRNDDNTFASFDSTSLQTIFDTFKQQISIIKETYNKILISNFHLYLKQKEKHSSPDLNHRNVVIFKKDNDFFYGVVSGIEGDQEAITCRGVEYMRPTSEIFHVASSTTE